MFIKRLKPNVYDVFVNNGWDNWARVVRKANNVFQIAGEYRLDRRTLHQVRERIVK